ncbi:hypothetical protein [Gordonia sp. MP11Mi]|uniref:Uncharacterized protein n=1 Tax=Gordonia sp. MP11Mi TaxID=3022769 RepID=A0AA97GX55_9ACTN
MITQSRDLNTTAPRGHFYASIDEYRHARPGHVRNPQSVVTGIQEEDALSVPGDVLAEWDVLFYPVIGARAVSSATGEDGAGEDPAGDVLAHRTLRRARHSRTSLVDDDSHPVVLLAADVPIADAEHAWQRVVSKADHDGTLSDLLIESVGTG